MEKALANSWQIANTIQKKVFKTIRSYGAESVIPHFPKVKRPLISLYVTKRFRVNGGKMLIEIYKRRTTAERDFKASKQELTIGKPKSEYT
ncbi:MAG: hypothetical protein QW279_00250 [Candidatus Jordarchaeaceae archaeon]